MARYVNADKLFEDFEKLIDGAKTEDVKPINYGKWISRLSENRHECTICGELAPYLSNHFELLSDFCPFCGADMREVF